MPNPPTENQQKNEKRKRQKLEGNLVSEGKMSINTWETSSQQVSFLSDLEEHEGAQGCPERAPGWIWDDLGEHFWVLRSGKTAAKQASKQERKRKRERETDRQRQTETTKDGKKERQLPRSFSRAFSLQVPLVFLFAFGAFRSSLSLQVYIYIYNRRKRQTATVPCRFSGP